MSSMCKTLIFGVVASSKLATGQTVDELPIVNVRLGPPTNALPQVAAEISLLEGARKDLETSHLQELDLAFAKAMKHASDAVPAVVASALGQVQGPAKQRSTSLLEVHDGCEGCGGVDMAAQRFAIEVVAPQEPDISIKRKLDQMEHKRSIDEEHIFQQAEREFAALEAIFTHEALAELHAQASGLGPQKGIGFLQTSKAKHHAGVLDLPQGLNVRLSASAQPFPTIESLALAMGDRRDASEDVVRNRVLELESQFFNTANNLLREALHAGLTGAA